MQQTSHKNTQVPLESDSETERRAEGGAREGKQQRRPHTQAFRLGDRRALTTEVMAV